jgi:peptidoglycan hydrolase CwlO-like protein
MMRKRKRFNACVAALLLCGALVAGTAQVSAQDIGTLQGKIDGARLEADGLAAEIESNEAAIAEAQTRAAAAAREEAQLTALLSVGREREAELTQQVSEAEERLAATRERLQRALGVLADRLVAIYKGEVPDAASLILEADGFDDLVTRAEYLQRLEESDADLAARVRALREQVQAQAEALERARAEVAAYNEQLEGARAQISAARAEAEAEAAALAEVQAQQASALEALRAQVDQWTGQVQRLQSISAAEAQQEVAGWFGDWAIPQAIVMCESGGSFGALNPSSGAGGAYQILPSTWETYGGEGKPHEASPQEQHEIASQIWEDSGSSAWVCAG